MAESHIDTRTPEEMLQQAYSRIISIGNAVIKANGWKHSYSSDKAYSFPFDPGQEYFYSKMNIVGNMRFYTFLRLKDGAPLVMTQYSEPPQTA